MIQLVQAAKPYKPEIGDLVCEWCKPEKSELYLDSAKGPGTDKVVPLCIIYPNPWVALEWFNIDAKPIMAKYECPYTNYKHFAIVPTALLLLQGDTKRYEKCKSMYGMDYILDWDFHKHMHKERRLEVFPIQKMLLGSGYTHGTCINDGHGSLEYARVNMDNGDALWVAFWEWYNK